MLPARAREARADSEASAALSAGRKINRPSSLIEGVWNRDAPARAVDELERPLLGQGRGAQQVLSALASPSVLRHTAALAWWGATKAPPKKAVQGLAGRSENVRARY